MKFTIKVVKEYDFKVLKVVANVRYWENAEVNGIEDVNGEIPCRIDDDWCIDIDIETGKITNWEEGKTAKVHYKVCDAGMYTLLDENNSVILKIEDYVPNCLAINDNGYGDYIILEIDEKGIIKDWKFDISGFTADEEEDY